MKEPKKLVDVVATSNLVATNDELLPQAQAYYPETLLLGIDTGLGGGHTFGLYRAEEVSLHKTRCGSYSINHPRFAAVSP